MSMSGVNSRNICFEVETAENILTTEEHKAIPGALLSRHLCFEEEVSENIQITPINNTEEHKVISGALVETMEWNKKKTNRSEGPSSLPEHITPGEPPKRTFYKSKKSLLKPSAKTDVSSQKGMKQYEYWETEGTCRLRRSEFSWNSPCFGYDKELGRSYYSSFKLHGVSFSVGDFVTTKDEDYEEFFRIIGVFQALKSFVGKTESVKIVQEIQKRGHPYLLLVPLIKRDEFRERANQFLLRGNHYFKGSLSSNEFFLKGHQHEETDESNINILPEWIGYWRDKELQKVEMHILRDAGQIPEAYCKSSQKSFEKYTVRFSVSKTNEWYCKKTKKLEVHLNSLRRELSPINESQFSILTGSATELRKKLPSRWYKTFTYTEQVQFTRHGRKASHEVGFYGTGGSSDDSDGFDEKEEENISIVTESSTSERKDEVDKRRLAKRLNFEDPLPHLVIDGKPYNYIQKKEEEEKRDFCFKYASFIEKLNSLAGTADSAALKSALDLFKGKVFEKGRSQKPLNDFVKSKKINREIPFHQRLQNRLHFDYHKENEKILQEKLGIESFRDLQAEVCLSARLHSNLIYIGPPGIGKSVCFIIPALCEKGITLIIEPINAIIDQHIQKLKKLGIKAEQLLSQEKSANLRRLKAVNRLCKFKYEMDKGTFEGPVLLYATPEIVNQNSVINILYEISKKEKLHRVVLDEFDEAMEASRQSREAYLEVLQNLLQKIRKLNYSLLSATFKPENLKTFLDRIHIKVEDIELPSFYESETFLPKNLIFRVERKVSMSQAVTRTVSILKRAKNDLDQSSPMETTEKNKKNRKFPKTVCYCLTPAKCDEAKRQLEKHNIYAEVYSGKTSQSERDRILHGFNKRTVDVICATTALGRGVDIADIRYVFHLMPPFSLSNYIQETGRAGRDGKTSFCFFFYRPHDEQSVKIALRLEGIDPLAQTLLDDEEKRKKLQNLNDMREYATCGDKYCCRKEKLKSKTTFSGREKNYQQVDIQNKNEPCCDHCYSCSSSSNIAISVFGDKDSEMDVSQYVYFLLQKYQKIIDQGGYETCREVKKMFRELIQETKSGLNADDKKSLQYLFQAGGKDFSLEEDLIRLLINIDILERSKYGKKENKTLLINKNNCGQFLEQLTKKEIYFKVLNAGKYFSDDFNLDIEDDMESEGSHEMEEDSHQDYELSFDASIDDENFTSESLQANETQDVLSLEVLPKKREANHHESILMRRSKRLKACENAAEIKAIESSMVYTSSLIKTPNAIPLEWNEYLPFLVHFELCRLYNNREHRITESHIQNEIKEKFQDSGWSWNDYLKSCIFLNELAGTQQDTQKYVHALETFKKCHEKIPIDSGPAIEKNGFFFGTFLYFTANLHGNSMSNMHLELQPPEKAHNRRIYRKYGSHRFLDIRVQSNAGINCLKGYFANPLWICGRLYRLLWAKLDKAPQNYIFFAEKGKGIEKSDEFSVDQVRDWMIPSKLNPDLTVEKYFKRVKLCFSKTIPAGVLPENSVELIPDVTNEENVMTDGGGLISFELMKDLQIKYNEYIETETELLGDKSHETHKKEFDPDDICSSFQGRIGGFKGQWTLDPCLTGKKIQCRDSQNKYGVPMKSMGNIDQAYNDEFYDTVDICSWDENDQESEGMNVQLIQILEHRGVSIDFFKECADNGTLWISKMKTEMENGNNFDLAKKMPSKFVGEDNSGSFDVLKKMAYAGVGLEEPVMRKLVCDLWRSETKAMRDKAKYPVSGCKTLRMIPDHTQLLEEGEAFIPHRYRIASESILAMRSPAYFAGDLLKLRLVSLSTIMSRVHTKPKPQTNTDTMDKAQEEKTLDNNNLGGFFLGLRTGLILSTRGKRSAADMMSGGDFDGDKAWVCWNKNLVDQVQECHPADTTTPDFAVKKSEAQKSIFAETPPEKLLEYIWHYRNHHTNLTKLSTKLTISTDFYGFDHKISRALGTQAFLQVDHPYVLCEVDEDTEREFRTDTKGEIPRWKSKSKTEKTYEKMTALGVLHDYMNEKLETMDELYGKENQRNKYVMELIRKEESKSNTRVISLRGKLREIINQANKEVSEKLQASSGSKTESSWYKDHYHQWRKKLFDVDSEDEKRLIASLLYEQTAELSALKSTNDNETVLLFAWMVGHEILIQIISSAKSKEGDEKTSAITMTVEMANAICTRKKN